MTCSECDQPVAPGIPGSIAGLCADHLAEAYQRELDEWRIERAELKRAESARKAELRRIKQAKRAAAARAQRAERRRAREVEQARLRRVLKAEEKEAERIKPAKEAAKMYRDGHTLQDIGHYFDVSREGARQMVRRVLSDSQIQYILAVRRARESPRKALPICEICETRLSGQQRFCDYCRPRRERLRHHLAGGPRHTMIEGSKAYRLAVELHEQGHPLFDLLDEDIKRFARGESPW